QGSAFTFPGRISFSISATSSHVSLLDDPCQSCPLTAFFSFPVTIPLSPNHYILLISSQSQFCTGGSHPSYGQFGANLGDSF
uniref:Uncharacterized protein n=1 Tax=Aegilops tauschii subsp. strangulata TaxID=200361 RepID=A0A453HPT5_AEGTS